MTKEMSHYIHRDGGLTTDLFYTILRWIFLQNPPHPHPPPQDLTFKNQFLYGQSSNKTVNACRYGFLQRIAQFTELQKEGIFHQLYIPRTVICFASARKSSILLYYMYSFHIMDFEYIKFTKIFPSRLFKLKTYFFLVILYSKKYVLSLKKHTCFTILSFLFRGVLKNTYIFSRNVY